MKDKAALFFVNKKGAKSVKNIDRRVKGTDFFKTQVKGTISAQSTFVPQIRQIDADFPTPPRCNL